MSIVPLKKATILGASANKRQILARLQQLGALHLIPLSDTERDTPAHTYEKLVDSIRYLKACPKQRRAQTPTLESSLEDIVQQVLANKRERNATLDEIEITRKRIKLLIPWGSFDYPELEDLAGYRLWFYCVPLSREHELSAVQLPWKKLSRDHKQSYVVVLSKSEPHEQQVPFARVHVGSRNLRDLKQRLEQCYIRLEELGAQRETLTRWLKPLQHSLDQSINLAKLNEASALTFESEPCFALKAWLPLDAESELSTLAKELGFAFVLSEPEEDELPPTLLKNSEVFGGAESAVRFFQLPGYYSWDPSVVIFFSFSLFFAIILADAGYAVIMLFWLGLKWRKLSQTSGQRQLRNFLFALFGGATVYGVLIASYFGIVLAPENPLTRLQILDLNDFASMMQLSIGIGAAHLVIANAAAGWQSRFNISALANLGWILAISSGYIAWFRYVRYDTAPQLYSLSALAGIAGVCLIVCFAGNRKIHNIKDFGIRAFDGVLGFYQLTKAFGDILSYMRLFALGLSSASLAFTFNQLAIDARDAVPAGGIILFLLIVILGHLLNFILAIMGGVIHGLRLNLLEFYNWGIKGEGTPFIAFKEQNTKN